MIGTHKTTIEREIENGQHLKINVVYHSTKIFSWDKETSTITLNTGGWDTYTTKKRMNQCLEEFGFAAKVYQKNFNWFCSYQGRELEFKNNKLIISLT